ncbi:ABC transporter substrate-binding protein [Marinomonas epiphytica]
MKITKWYAALVTVMGLMSANIQAQENEMTLMLDWFVNPNHGPIIIAQQQGYFAEQGIDLVIQEPSDPSTPAKLVAAGKVDLAVSYQPNLIMDVAAGLPLIRAATLIATPLNTLTVLDNGKINSIADLRGKTIGISVSGNEEAIVGTMLKAHGVAYDEVTVINIGWALSSSLASGRVDATWGGFRNFEANQLELEGIKAKAYFPEEHQVPIYDELVFVANSQSYDKGTLQAFNQAIEKGVTYILNHPQESWLQFVQYAPDTLDNELNKRAWQDTLRRFALRPSALDRKRYRDYAKFMHAQGLIDTLPAPASYLPSLSH